MVLAVFFTWLSYLYSNILIFGMNDYFFDTGNYLYWVLQMFTSQFLHWSVLHIVSNAIFILYFWNVLERTIGREKYLLFFVTSCVFIWMVLTFLTSSNTIWISWFALGVLTYYTLILWSKWNPEYTWWITAIAINIFIGFAPGISFLGHFAWMVFWAVFWYISDKWISPKKNIQEL